MTDMLCPLCCTTMGYDGKHCTHCGMSIVNKTNTHFKFTFCLPDFDLFSKSLKLNNPSDLLENHNLVPTSRGIYAWFFDKVPSRLPQNLKYIKFDEMYLLYVGIAGGDLTKQGHLRKRICGDHLKGNYKASTLAQSLHAILNIHKDNIAERTEWMKKHMKVAWAVHPNPKVIESEILTNYGSVLPLNLQENTSRNPFAEELTALRTGL